MYREKKILGVIPARGGSKGIPRKNIAPVLGRPLLDWTVEEAKHSRYLDHFILSSEDSEIIKVAKSLGCPVPFERPSSLAADDTPGVEPILHAVRQLTGFDYVVVLQPTSPLRSAFDIDMCIETCINQAAKTCVSVVEERSNPYWSFTLAEHGKLLPVMSESERPARRQDLPKIYALNGAVYVAEVAYLEIFRTLIDQDTIAYVMPEERSLDIDTPLDLDFLRFYLAKSER